MSNSHVQLYQATSSGNLEQVQRILRGGLDCSINWLHSRQLTSTEETALHAACRNGYAAIIQELLQYKADINYKDSSQWSPIHHASFYGRSEALRVLVAHPQVNINATTYFNCTALYLAACEKRLSCVQVLLDAKPDTSIPGKDNFFSVC